jgi:hypothetical protein
LALDRDRIAVIVADAQKMSPPENKSGA